MPFLAVVTKWTKEPDKAALADYPNIRLLPGAPSERMDKEVYRRTRVLCAPSLWPEPFGLVALEAALRAIPALSSDLAGLNEANVVPENVVPAGLVHDVELAQTYVPPPEGSSASKSRLHAFEQQRPDLVNTLFGRPTNGPVQSREATDDDVLRFAKRFAAKLDPLMAQGDAATKALKTASHTAYERAHAHLDARRHSMATLFRSLERN